MGSQFLPGSNFCPVQQKTWLVSSRWGLDLGTAPCMDSARPLKLWYIGGILTPRCSHQIIEVLYAVKRGHHVPIPSSSASHRCLIWLRFGEFRAQLKLVLLVKPMISQVAPYCSSICNKLQGPVYTDACLSEPAIWIGPPQTAFCPHMPLTPITLSPVHHYYTVYYDMYSFLGSLSTDIDDNGQGTLWSVWPEYLAITIFSCQTNFLWLPIIPASNTAAFKTKCCTNSVYKIPGAMTTTLLVTRHWSQWYMVLISVYIYYYYDIIYF